MIVSRKAAKNAKVRLILSRNLPFFALLRLCVRNTKVLPHSPYYTACGVARVSRTARTMRRVWGM